MKAVATNTASFADVIRIVSDTLPAGTPVVLRYRGSINGATEGGLGNDLDWPTVEADLTAAYAVGSSTLSLNREAGDSSREVLIDTVVGATLDISGSLTAVAYGASGPNTSSPRVFSFTGRANGIGQLSIDPITPGFRVESESGTSYVTVPEPGCVGVMGVVGLVLLTRRRG